MSRTHTRTHTHRPSNAAAAAAAAAQPLVFTLAFVPRRTMICERVLEDEGVIGEVQMVEYQLDLLALEDDVLSLALDGSYRECVLDGDRTSLHYVARAICKLQAMFGIVPDIRGKGHAAKQVADMLVRMRKETEAEEAPIVPEFDSMIIIDREVDMVTPLCTQLTYTGLIDEMYGIRNGVAEFDAALVAPKKDAAPGAAPPAAAAAAAPAPGAKTKVPLNGTDKLFAEVRDVNFATLGPLLNAKAKRIDEYYKRRSQLEDLSAVQSFIRDLGGYQAEHKSLVMHTAIAGKLAEHTNSAAFRKHLEWEQSYLAGASAEPDFIEDCICQHKPIIQVLRLLCLFSLTCNGLKPKVFDHFRREILQTYGFEYVFTLNNLEKLGMLKRQEARSGPWPTLRRSLQLIVEDLNEARPNDIAYVFSGYAPLSVRLVQTALTDEGWHGLDDVLKLLPGPTFQHTQALPEGVSASESRKSGVVLVVFVGGVTLAELAALRFLSLLDNSQREFVVLTTSVINGNTLLESLVDKVGAAE